MTPLKTTLLLAVSLTAFGQSTTPPAVKAGDFVYVSGVTAPKGDVREQTRQVLDHLSRIL